jgi:hypothetical protein
MSSGPSRSYGTEPHVLTPVGKQLDLVHRDVTRTRAASRRVYGTTATDWQARVDFNRLRRERLARARQIAGEARPRCRRVLRRIRRYDACPDPRLREIMQAFVAHVHGFVAEVGLTPEEWRRRSGS